MKWWNLKLKETIQKININMSSWFILCTLANEYHFYRYIKPCKYIPPQTSRFLKKVRKEIKLDEEWAYLWPPCLHGGGQRRYASKKKPPEKRSVTNSVFLEQEQEETKEPHDDDVIVGEPKVVHLIFSSFNTSVKSHFQENTPLTKASLSIFNSFLNAYGTRPNKIITLILF